MATDADVTNALYGILSTPLPTAFAGVPFDPPTADDAMWIELRDMPNEPDELVWGDNGPVMFKGILRILVYFRPARGAEGQRRYLAAVDQAEQVMAQYAKGTIAGPVRVSRRPWRSGIVEEDSGVFVPVTVPYRGIAN